MTSECHESEVMQQLADQDAGLGSKDGGRRISNREHIFRYVKSFIQ